QRREPVLESHQLVVRQRHLGGKGRPRPGGAERAVVLWRQKGALLPLGGGNHPLLEDRVPAQLRHRSTRVWPGRRRGEGLAAGRRSLIEPVIDDAPAIWKAAGLLEEGGRRRRLPDRRTRRGGRCPSRRTRLGRRPGCGGAWRASHEPVRVKRQLSASSEAARAEPPSAAGACSASAAGPASAAASASSAATSRSSRLGTPLPTTVSGSASTFTPGGRRRSPTVICASISSSVETSTSIARGRSRGSASTSSVATGWKR